MYRYNKLRGRIIEKFGTQEKFAKAVGISENSLSKKCSVKLVYLNQICLSGLNYWIYLLKSMVNIFLHKKFNIVKQ